VFRRPKNGKILGSGNGNPEENLEERHLERKGRILSRKRR
jgi:hypothetical protein